MDGSPSCALERNKESILERNKESILERNKESIKVVINGLI